MESLPKPADSYCFYHTYQHCFATIEFYITLYSDLIPISNQQKEVTYQGSQDQPIDAIVTLKYFREDAELSI